MSALKARRGRRGFTLIETLVMGVVLITGALFLAQSMVSQKKNQSDQQTIIVMRKILAEEVARVLQSPDRFPVLPVAGTAAVMSDASGLLGPYPMRMSYVACYSRDAATVANRMGYVGYVAARVDNMQAMTSSGCSLGGAIGGGMGPGALGGIGLVGGTTSECSFGAELKEQVKDSGQCDPATAQYEAQVSPGLSGSGSYIVLVRPLWTESQIRKKGGILRTYVKQSLVVSTGR